MTDDHHSSALQTGDNLYSINASIFGMLVGETTIADIKSSVQYISLVDFGTWTKFMPSANGIMSLLSCRMLFIAYLALFGTLARWSSSCRCESDRCCRVGGFRVQRGVQRGNWDWCFLRSYVIGQLDCGARCSTPPGRAWIGRL
ncbi:hypothetical protein T05_7202 [Trichinella murrelli]|uniref:Uncharacterized protein n=1 Tax=Trichinella murrelli TaxID=144512 RepID=A0A0V0TMG7_9BILA|nr:hypothetical protein T05_7202 [Trichinella murrelli]